jgi:exopolyphosphatase/guanosine-5'-triphosphate,3'-diphosphate pyrophosphatase
MTTTNVPPKKLYAGIDLGSNTIRLIIGYVDNSELHTVKKNLNITRLGRDFHSTFRLSEESKKKSIDTLIEFSDIIREYNVNKVCVCGTGILRRAVNSKEFIDEVFEKTGLKVSVISGEDEARLTALGVKSVVNADNSLIFDVGGGSTEFIFSKKDAPPTERSIDIGAVTLFEAFIKSDPPRPDELKSMNNQIKDAVVKLKEEICKNMISSDEISSEKNNGFGLIFTAGTATTLAAMDMKMESYDPDMVNNHELEYDKVRSLYNELVKKNKEEREKITGLEKGREDIIISGTAIALNVMEVFNKHKMTISDTGLLEGIVIDLHQHEFPSP